MYSLALLPLGRFRVSKKKPIKFSITQVNGLSNPNGQLASQQRDGLMHKT